MDGAGKSLKYWVDLREFWTDFIQRSGGHLCRYTVLRNGSGSFSNEELNCGEFKGGLGDQRSVVLRLPILYIAHPVRRPVPLLPVFRDSVVSKRRTHPSTSLVLKRGIRPPQALLAQAAAVSLTLQHPVDSSGVFAPARGRIDAHFPSVSISADGSV